MYFPRITDLRKEHHLTQQNVADLLHCPREVYRRYEKGAPEIPISSVIVLAKYYNVSVDYLLGESDQKERF
ncbi:MAG: helix-turn-helix transcriptional regulator [Agathobacter sp.]|nr:helix-turn-helix transcriptional regulator [Agathobacter sp.]